MWTNRRRDSRQKGPQALRAELGGGVPISDGHPGDIPRRLQRPIKRS
jgi:hypothetical protein